MRLYAHVCGVPLPACLPACLPSPTRPPALLPAPNLVCRPSTDFDDHDSNFIDILPLTD